MNFHSLEVESIIERKGSCQARSFFPGLRVLINCAVEYPDEILKWITDVESSSEMIVGGNARTVTNEFKDAGVAITLLLEKLNARAGIQNYPAPPIISY